MRQRLFALIKPRSEETIYGKCYDIVMIIVICLSLLPLMFKEQTDILIVINRVTVTIFILDYILRWITADFFFGEKGLKPFLRYPFSLMAILDLLSILPSITILFNGLKAVRIVRLIKALKVIKVFRLFRYSKNIEIIITVLHKQRDAFVAVILLATGYIFITALVIFQVEPETYNTFFDAVYWATISLMTVGYGDIYAVTPLGRLITMISALVGVAIVALPAGIITAGYMDEIRQSDNKNDKSRAEGSDRRL